MSNNRRGPPARSPAPSTNRLASATALHQAGRFPEAEAAYRQILAAEPGNVDALHLLGVVALQTGRLADARSLITQAIERSPRLAAAHSNLGNVHLREQHFDDARRCFERAVALQPSFGDAHFNLANLLRREGRLQEAATHFRRATSANPRSFQAHQNLGATLLDLGDARSAAAAFETAAKLAPGNADALSGWGIALAKSGEPLRGLQTLDRALEVDPKSTSATLNRGVVLAGLARYDEAVEALESVLARDPKSAEAHCNLGNVLRERGDATTALAHFDRALHSAPTMQEARVGRAAALRDLGREAEGTKELDEIKAGTAESVPALMFEATAALERSDLEEAGALLRKAITMQPAQAEAHWQLGNLLMRQMRPADAIESYRRALSHEPENARARWALAIAQIPPLYRDAGEVAKSRANFERMLGELERWFQADRTAAGHLVVGSTQPFYLAYQPVDNRPLLARYGALCSRLVDDWQRRNVAPTSVRRPGRIRIGVVSAQIRDHSVWNAIVKGWLSHLDRRRFDVNLFALGTSADAETEAARRTATRFEGGRREFANWARTIQQNGIDVLLYPEIGMDPMTARLASLRLAPVQVATWGHPETTGFPSIDYFISAEALEPPDAERYYTEKLVRLPNLGVCYQPLAPTRAPPDLAALGLPSDAPLLLCPGTPFKYLPQQDTVWLEISRRAPSARLVFFQPTESGVSDIFEQRLKRCYEQAKLDWRDHIAFVPAMDRPRFFGLMAHAAATLDTIGFSGFNTAMQAIEAGAIFVGYEGEFLRGRLASGILRRMGMDELVATSDEAFVDLAVGIASDEGRRSRLREEIIERRNVLFGDTAPVEALQRFMESAVRV